MSHLYSFALKYRFIGAWILDFIYPPCCHLCRQALDAPDAVICDACDASIQPLSAPYCDRCGAPLDSLDDACDACSGRTFYFISARAAADFNEPVQQLVHLLKYKGKRAVGRYLGSKLVEAIRDEIWYERIDMVIPMPLHPTRKRERGYNQSEILAQGFADRASLPMYNNLVVRHRPTRSQTKLTPEQRAANVRNVFRVTDASALKGKRVALVDDVLTTGSTLNSCARTLIDAGADEVYALAVARA